MKKYIIGAVSGLVLLVLGVALEWPDNKLHVVACDVGQGDGILIWRGFSQVVVDGGPNEKIIDCLSDYIPFWDRRIELVVLTNGDADHMTGLIDLVERYKIDQMITNNLVKDTERFKAFRLAVVKAGLPVYAPKMGEEVKVNGLRFKVLWPEERLGEAVVWIENADEKVLGVNSYSQSEANEQSVVMKLEYGNFEALLTGDIGSKSERVLINSGLNLRSDVLKVGHHGSRYSSSEAFLEAVKPQLAVISVGKNRYGHPASETLERLKFEGIQVHRTDEQGNLEVVGDGKKMWVR